jgi:two-component system sensor kinase FixL
MPPSPHDPAAAFDLLPALVRRADGPIVRWTSGAVKLYGWPQDAAVGQRAQALLATEPDGSEEEIEAALQRHGVWQGTVRQRAADGRTLKLAAYWAREHDTIGGSEVIVEVATALQAGDRATRDALHLTAVVDSLEEAIIGKDLGGRITSWNRVAEQMFGYRADEAIGQPITLVLPPERVAEDAAILDRIGRGLAVNRHESTRRHKDGTIVPILLAVTPVRDAAGRIIGAATVARDISEMIRDREALRASQAELVHVSRLTELGQIASALAHEINQPLTAIGNYASGARRLLATGNATGAGTALQRIAEQAERGAQIVLRLRDFMRKRDTEKHPESLPAVIDEAWALAMVGQRNRPVRLTRLLAPEVGTVVLDRVQIEQVLFNLFRNAIEAMADAPRQELTVTTSRRDQNLAEVQVADTGPGLPETVQARLFQPFVTTKPNGLGIGLSICRGIVQAHGGTLTAEAGPDGGTVFRFTLLIAPPTAGGAKP